MRGACSQCFSCTGFAPAQACVLSQSTLLRLQVALPGTVMWSLGCMRSPGLSRSGSGSWVLHKGADLVGPAFWARPRSEQLSWPGAWWAWSPPVKGCGFLPPPSQTLSFLGVQRARLLRCSVCLFWGADLWLRPSRQISTVRNPKKSWLASKPACSLVDDASLGPRLPPAGSSCPRLPVSGRGWSGLQPASSAQSFVLWACLVVS